MGTMSPANSARSRYGVGTAVSGLRASLGSCDPTSDLQRSLAGGKPAGFVQSHRRSLLLSTQAVARCFAIGSHPAFILGSGGAERGTVVEHSCQGQADEDRWEMSACQLRQAGLQSSAQAASANYCSGKSLNGGA